MSGHEHERLSAYLDDELPPRRAGPGRGAPRRLRRVRGAGWPSSRRWTSAVARPAGRGPAGYFEAFPARVRARLERRAAARRLPVWTWARGRRAAARRRDAR